MNSKDLIKDLNNNKIIAHPTDTVFGLFAKLSKQNILELNKLKKRNEDKPLQIMFSSVKEALKFSINDHFVMNYLHNNYEEGTSYIVPANTDFAKKFLLPSFNRTFMFRIPKNKEIIDIIKEAGPLAATSANISGKTTITNNEEIKKIFKVNTSSLEQKNNKASKIISLLNDEITEVR